MNILLTTGLSTISDSGWIQLIMNNLVMPGLVVVLFKTLIENHKSEIEQHLIDKKALQEQIKQQSEVMEKVATDNSKTLQHVSTVLEKMDKRLENVEKCFEDQAKK